MKNQNWKKLLFLLLFILLLAPAAIHVAGQVPFLENKQTVDTAASRNEIKFYLKKPSTWIQNRINKLNTLTLPYQPQLDTLSIQYQLRKISTAGDFIRDNLVENSGSLRLRFIHELNNELLTDINILLALQKKLQEHNNFLTSQNLVSVSIANEIDYFRAHADSTIKEIYKNEIDLLTTKLVETDSFLTNRLMRLVRMEASVNNVAFQLQEIGKFAQSLIAEKGESINQANYPPLWKTVPSDYTMPVNEILSQTGQQIARAVRFFNDHGSVGIVLNRIFLLLLVIGLLFGYYYRHKREEKYFTSLRYLPDFPVEASLILVLMLAPYLFVHAPFIFLDFIFIAQTLVVSILVIKKYGSITVKSLVIVLTVYILLKMVNLLVSPTYVGRIFMGAAILILFPMHRLYRDYISIQKERNTLARIIISLLILQMSAGWVLSFLGYFMLGRAYFISAMDSFILAVCLFVAVHTILDYLAILTAVINNNLKSFHVDYEIINRQIGKLLAAISVFILITTMLRNINVYSSIESAVLHWLTTSRELGQSSFTLHSIFLFLAYLAGSVFIAGFVSKVIDTKDNKKIFKRRTYLGSFMLLFRFTVVSFGFILAVIASGIPVTQLTVLMGALGVGIGFGLQNIFNNMVSGLIIAIEKPISVGDMIEVGTNTGWVRDIGIRSSNIQSFDGAEIIVPNGEIISNRITNWTLSDKRRRLEVIIGVAYKSDPHQVYNLLKQVVDGHPEILKNPDPFIIFTGLGDSSLDFKVQFWISDFIEGNRIKSDVLLSIFDVLKANSIEIPYPQQDLHLKSVDPNVFKQVSSGEGN